MAYDGDMAQQNMDEPSGDLCPSASYEHPETDAAGAPRVQAGGGGNLPPARTAMGTGGTGGPGGVPPGDRLDGWGQNSDDWSWEGDHQSFVAYVRSFATVEGYVVVGHDGLVQDTDWPSSEEAESIGVWGLGVYMNSEHVARKLGLDRVCQIRSVTASGSLHIADLAGCLVVVICK